MAFADDFDDVPEDDSSPLLPADDRLWRHPSELGSGGSVAVDPSAVRRRWLQNQPSRASAWTAGLVGALLATGLVALGTHLATAITSPPAADAGASTPTNTVLEAVQSPEEHALATNLVSSLAASISEIDASMVLVDIANGSTHQEVVGLVVRSDGVIVVPATDIAQASSIQVSVPTSGTMDVGHVMGVDAESGIALLQIEGLSGLPSISLSSSSSLGAPSYTLALTSPQQNAARLGVVEAVDSPPGPGDGFVDVIETNLPASDAPLGTVLMDAGGSIAGIVTGTKGNDAVATPSWLLAPVVNQLIATGSVVHGWLGVGVTNASGNNAGAVITSVVAHSAAAEAGLRAHDVIVSMNGQSISSATQLRGRLYVLKPDTEVTLRVQQANKRRTVHLALDDRES